MNIFEEFFNLNVENNLLLIVVIVIVSIVLISKYLSRYIATLFYNLFKKAGRNIPKAAYYNLLAKPLQKFIVWCTVIFALYKLKLPPSFENFKLIGKVNCGQILEFFGVCILIFVFLKFILCLIEYTATILEEKANLTQDQSDNQLIVFFKDFFKVIVILIGFLLVLKFGFQQKIGNLLTGLSLVGAALALATKESLENLIASFVIFFDKPFTTGDEVKVLQVSGVVEKIGLRSTRIRTSDKTYVSVPNKQMVDTVVDNISMRTKRKVILDLEFNVTTTLEQINVAKLEIEKIFEQQTAIENHTIYFAAIAKTGILLSVEYYTSTIATTNFINLKDTINSQILSIINDLKIEFAAIK